MRKTVVLNCVGLTRRLVSSIHTPRINALARPGGIATIRPVLPAVTCSVQSTYLTGAWPSEHGIVGNGWYDRDDGEIKFWKQSNKLVRGEKLWDLARRRHRDFTCANICWWYAMYSSADYTVTPRPMYPADGRKIPDCWTHPPESRDDLQKRLGPFPLFKFWGPATSIDSTRWITDAAIMVDQNYDPTLSLVYLPHLDYNFQRFGPDHPQSIGDLRELDTEVGRLIDHFAQRNAAIVLLSEYGIAAVSRPIHVNRILRNMNLISTRMELGRELLDAGESRAFAVADHQIAHVYVNDRSVLSEIEQALKSTPGVAGVYRDDQRRIVHLDHERSGDLIVLAEPNSWFTYYYWLDDSRAPDFARTVDIHRKPGYDPVELFLDPAILFPKLRIGATLLKRKLGLRAMMEVICLDANVVRGSHGIAPRDPMDGAMIATTEPALLEGSGEIDPTSVRDLILRHIELS